MHGDMRQDSDHLRVTAERSLVAESACESIQSWRRPETTFISPLNGKIYEIFRKLAAYFCKPSLIDA
jgi:hypothetical protein